VRKHPIERRNKPITVNRLVGTLAYGLILWYAGYSWHLGLRSRKTLGLFNLGAVAALQALRKAYATRPSDAMVGKPTNGTATDWVTRGPLNLHTEAWGLNVQSSQH